MKITEHKTRLYTQKSMGLVFIFLLVGGLLWPYLGLAVMAMMVGFLGFAISNSRTWCGWVCPRGSFLERYLLKEGVKP